MSNNLVQGGAEVSAIDVPGNVIFERLYLVSGLRNVTLFVIMPLAPTSPPLGLQLFHDFRAIFVPSGLSIIFSGNSPSNLAESRYPHSLY